MKKALKKIAEAFHRYNPEHMEAQAFGLGKDMRIKRHGHMTRNNPEAAETATASGSVR